MDNSGNIELENLLGVESSSSTTTGQQRSFPIVAPSSGGSSVPSLSGNNGGAGGGAGGSSSVPIFLGRQVVGSFLVLICGEYGPRWFFSPTEHDMLIRNADIPYQTMSSGEIILDFELNRPLVDPPTIPSGLLILTAFVLPLVIVIVQGWRSANRNRYDMSAGVSGFFIAMGLSEFATLCLKFYVRRRRPNFYALCQFSIVQLQCMASFEDQLESQLSFPSGHSSLTFCGMTYLVLYFSGKVGIQQYYNYGTTISSSNNGSGSSIPWSKRFVALVSCLGPWAWAATVAASRIVDHWHHPSDVAVGTMLGTLAAVVAYHWFYHPIGSLQAGIPLMSSSSSSSSSRMEKLPTFHD